METRLVLPQTAATAPPEILELLARYGVTNVIDYGTAASMHGSGYAALTDEGVVLISPDDDLMVGITWEELTSLPAAPSDASVEVIIPFPVDDGFLELDIDRRLLVNIQAAQQQTVARQPLFVHTPGQ